MKNKKLITFFLTITILFSSFVCKPIKAEETNTEYVEHEVIIVCKDIESIIKDNQTYELLGELQDEYIYLLIDNTLSSEELLSSLKNNENISSIEYNWINQESNDEINEEISNETLSLLSLNETENTIADATKYQWAMNNDGHMMGTGNGVDMNYSAWDSQTNPGLKEVVVAVIDCGVDIYNTDLNIWNDPGNIGLWNTYPNADKFGFNNAGGGDESTFYLERNHGTHCAGIIGALWNNEGTSGVAPNAKIMSVRHDDCFSSFVECFEYVLAACQAGVPIKVTSNSWGTGAVHSDILDRLVRQLGEEYNVVSVFSAGNSYNNDDKTSANASVMSENPYAIIVGAINPDGTRSEFSGYGNNSVDIYAPGTMIISTDATTYTYDENALNYYPEFDEDYINLQTFDGSDSYITFNTLLNNGASIKNNMGYDDSHCLYVPKELLQSLPRVNDSILLSTDYNIDLSSLEEKPQYLAFKFLPVKQGKLDFMLTNYYIPIVAEDGSTARYSGIFIDNAQTTSANGWGSAFIDLTDFSYDWELDTSKEWTVDYENFYLQLQFTLQNDSYENIYDYDLCIDMFAMGDELVPYIFMSGTSMAAPAVAGQVAVIFGTYPNMKADEVVARILCGTNQKDAYSLKNLCKTEEIANVDKSLSNELTPYIENITVQDDNTLILSGRFFNKILKAEVRFENENKYISLPFETVGKNKISVTLPENNKGGILTLRLANIYGTSPIKQYKLNDCKEYKYYDYSIEIPEEIDNVLDTFDGFSLTAYNDYIYVLQQVSEVSAKYQGDLDSIPNKMVRYDINNNNWEVMNLPLKLLEKHIDTDYIRYYSATAYQGKLFVAVTSNKDNVAKSCILSLDQYDHWKIETKYTEDIPSDCYTLTNIDNKLYFVGTNEGGILKWDNETNTYIHDGEAGRQSPNVTTYNNDLWISGGTISGLAGETSSVIEKLEYKSNDEEIGPRYVPVEEYNLSKYVEQMKDMYYGVATVKNGIIAVGPTSIDNKSDTYLIPIERGQTKEPISLNIRAYDGPLYRPAAIGYKDNLYVIAVTTNNKHIFSYTTMDTFNYPGDIYKPEKEEKQKVIYIPVATGIE